MLDIENDTAILDTDFLWRRVHPKWWVADGSAGRRLSSQAFQKPTNGTGISVDLARLRSNPSEAVAEHPGYGLAQLAARLPRELQLGVVLRPLLENPAHAEITGTPSKGAQRALAGAAEVLILPTE